MAVMIPAEWSDKNGSHAERLVWHRLRDQTPDDWYAVHSVGLATHATKPWADADFVIVCGDGVVVLEVKGGRVRVEGGRWSTGEHALKESPFAQGGGASAALYGDLRDRFPALRKAIVGWGVVLPDVTFDREGPDIIPAVVYDDRDLASPIADYVRRVAAHWRTFHRLDAEGFRPLSRGERSAIVRYLTPSFDLVPTLRSQMAQAEYELARLTSQQLRIMRGLRAKDRVIVRGGAGTGKTMLALEDLRYIAATDRPSMFCCRSSLLARQVREQLDEAIQVWAFEELTRELVERAGMSDTLPPAAEADLRDVFLPEAACEAAIDLDLAGSVGALIVDEAQDLLTEVHLDFFDTLLDGGLAGGLWRVFLDHRQNVFAAVDLQQLERLQQSCVSEYDLMQNCRNTPDIATVTYMLAALEPDEVLAAEGPKVDLRWITEPREEGSTVGAITRAWLRRGVAPSEIVVLGIHETPPSQVITAIESAGARLSPIVDRGRTEIGWSTIDDFKGIESPAVIVTGIQDLHTRNDRRRLYVGCSRARTLLGLVLDIDLKDEFDLRATEYARLSADRPTA
jgi:Nuclease-related domain/UvrD-like helicase C-terminal domain/Schlafen group 3, DNA/RNA helicase domain